jgi:hypothetical protein
MDSQAVTPINEGRYSDSEAAKSSMPRRNNRKSAAQRSVEKALAQEFRNLASIVKSHRRSGAVDATMLVIISDAVAKLNRAVSRTSTIPNDKD